MGHGELRAAFATPITQLEDRAMTSTWPNTSFQRTQVRALRGLGPQNSDR